MSVGDLGEQIQAHSRVVRDLVSEVGKVLVGQEAMVSRLLIGLLTGGGLLGAITPRTGFFLSSFQTWREAVVLGETLPISFADLGYGVMDSAMVSAAAYCLEKRSP